MPDKRITEEQLKIEIEKIGEYISQAKHEIAAFALSNDTNDGSQKNIISAKVELNEVVRHTEEATNMIMDKADAIMAIAPTLADADAAAKLGEYAVSILEACSFQDITGQRIKKVLKTLQQVELRVGNLINLFGGKMPDGLEAGEIEVGIRRPDEDLLNGPQLKDAAASQDDIDKLFGSL